jgi:inhibitor of cysteine peptidase
MPRVVIGERENGTEVSMDVGDTLVLRLPENAAAGYQWTVTSIDAHKLEIATDAYESTRAGVGSAGASVRTFAARSAGRTRLELKKVRPWNPEDPAAERFWVELNIRGD